MKITLILFFFIVLPLQSQTIITDLIEGSSYTPSQWTDNSNNAQNTLTQCSESKLGPYLGYFAKSFQKTYNNLPPHYKILISIDLFLTGYWPGGSNYVKILVDQQEIFMKTNIQSSALNMSYDYCKVNSLLLILLFNQGTFTIDQEIIHTKSSLQIQVQSSYICTLLSLGLKCEEVGIKNIIIQVYECHKSCLTCSGVLQTQCLTCPFGVPINGSCQCQGYSYNFQCVTNCPTYYVPINGNCEIECSLNCDKCQGNKCVNCSASYPFNINGQCYSTCPPWTQNCIDLKDFSTIGSYYIGQFFYNNNLTDINYFSFNGSTQTGNGYTYYNNQLILGGFGVWGSGSNQIYFSQLQAHNKLRIYCQAYFIDNWNGQSLYIYVDNTQVYSQSVTSTAQSSNLMYKNSNDLIKNISITISHTSNSANIVFSTNLNQSPFIASLGITNLFILADYCDLNCQQCGIQFCSICSQGYNLVNNLCIVCNQTYNRNSDCSCTQGYYDDGSSQLCQQCSQQCSQCSNFNTCISCSPHYKTLPQCQNCEDGYYQDAGICKLCDNTCQTCSSQQTCISCMTGYGFKLDIDNLCHLCQPGYFIDGQNCLQCSNKCSDCQGVSTNCLNCQANRNIAPQCNCASGYYEDTLKNCSKCDLQCKQCASQSNQCTLCSGNRQQIPNCDCPDGGISRLQYNISYCSTCQLSVTIIQFSDDLTQIIIDLGLSIYQFQNCLNLIVNTNKLGNGVTCIIQSNYIIINLGQQPTIQVGDHIYLKNIKFLGCQVTASIMNNYILAPKNIIKPLIRFNLETYELLPCEQLRLDTIGIYLNGKRNLSIIGWSLININQQEILDKLNKQSSSFIINGQDYEINQYYQLRYSYTNFIQTLGETYFNFSIVSYRNPTPQIIKPSIIYTYLYNQIYTYIPILFCDQLQNSLNYTINFTIHNDSININISRNTTQNKEQFFIQDGLLANNQEYQIKCVFSFINYTAQVNDKFIAKGEESQLQIIGGSRQVGFRQSLQLQTKSSLSDDYEWGCYNIIELLPCDIQQNKSEQDFNPYTFQPFQLLQFTVKQGNQMDSIVISTIESDTPQIQIIMNEQYKTRLLNYYDELQFTIIYPILVNPDNLFYYVDILYNNNDTFFRVYYPQFAFRLWSYIDTNYTDITLQFSVFNPDYLVPSTSQVNLKLNIPPQYCKVSILNDTISVTNCQDEDKPLNYIYVYYTDQEAYQQDYKQSHIYKGIIIQNLTLDSQTNFKVPLNNSIILIQVLDYLLGITNITINVNQSQSIQDYQVMLQESDTNNLYRNMITLLLENKASYYQQINQICNSIKVQFYQEVQIKELLYPFINVSDTQITYDYQNITTIIQQETKQYQSLYIQYNSYYDQIGKLKQREHINKYSYFLSLIYSLNLHFQSKSNRRLLYKSNLLVNNLQAISDALESATLINGDQQQIITEQFNLSVIKQTDLFYNNSKSNSSSIYTQIFQTILNNPYQNDSNFNYQQDINSQLIIPILKINNTEQHNQSINLTFDNHNQTQQVCVNKINGFWSINDCQTKSQDNKIICICQQISPTTIVQAITQLTSSVTQLFTSESIEQINNMQIWFMAFTYIVIFFTIVYLISIYYGNKLDNMMLEEQQKLAAQIHPMNSPLPVVDEEKIEDDSEKIINKQNTIKLPNPNDDSNIEKPRQDFKRMTRRFYSNKITILRIKSQEDDDNQSKQNDITKLDVKEFKSITTESEQKSSQSITISAQIRKQVVNHLSEFWTYVKLWHDIISIYYRNDPRTSRIHRITIIYISMLGQISIITVFGKILSLNTILALTILQDLFRFTFKAIINYLLNHDNQIMRIIGGISVLISTGLFLFLIIASMATYEDVYIANLWAISYVCSFFINYFIYNTIGLAFYYIIIFKFYNIEIVKKILDLILDDQMIKLFSRK